MNDDTPGWLRSARDHWRWRGQGRPPFAVAPGAGQVSVWDFPRPPTIEVDGREVVVRWGDIELARTRRAVKVLETAHPPTWYLPWADVDRACFDPTGSGSFCEWKGPARYFDLVVPGPVAPVQVGGKRLAGVAWSYPKPLAGAEALADCVSLYPAALQITVDGASVRPQPGGFYGGWITPELVGPFKGEPGSEGW